MQGQRGRNERRAGVFFDMVLSFISPEGNRMLFPLVFLLAALLNGIRGIFELKTCARDKKRIRLGIFQLFLGAGLGLLGVLSALSLWIHG